MILQNNDNLKIVTTKAEGTDDVLGGPQTVDYVRFSNIYFKLAGYKHTYSSTDCDMVVIKAEVIEESGGYMFGFKTATSEMSISKSGTTLTWKMGSNTHTETWTAGVHLFGFTSDGYAYYDGKKGSSLLPSSGTYSCDDMFIGGIKDTSSGSTVYNCLYGGSYPYLLYEVVVNAYYGTSPRQLAHVYAVQDGSNGKLYVARGPYGSSRLINRSSGSSGGGTAVREPGSRVGYGIQLHDLKAITGSGYNDILAITCDDGGPDYDAGYDSDTAQAPYKIDNKNFAFNLPSIPIPSGKTRDSSRTDHLNGELIRGRRPKWSIWADGIKFGKHGVTDGAKTKMKFNIFKENTGQNLIANVDKFELEKFEGYDTGAVHAPSFQWSGKVILEAHNGIVFRTSKANAILGSSSSDELAVFTYDLSSDGDLGVAKLGNLPLWNYSKAEQDYAIAHSTGLEKLNAVGGGLIIKANDAQSPDGLITIGTMLEFTTDVYSGSELIQLSSDSSAAVVQKFRDDGFDCSNFFRSFAVDYLRTELSRQGFKHLSVAMALTHNVTQDPADNEMVDCSDLVPAKDGLMSGLFDAWSIMPYGVSGGGVVDSKNREYDRIVVGEQGGTADINGTEYLIGAMATSSTSTYNTNMVPVSNNSSTISAGYGFGFGFALKAKDSDTFLKLFGTSSTETFGYLEMVEELKTTSSVTVTKTTMTSYKDKYTVNGSTALYHCDVCYSGYDTITRTENASTGVITYMLSYAKNKLVTCYAMGNGVQTNVDFASDDDGDMEIIITPSVSSFTIQVILDAEHTTHENTCTAFKFTARKIQNRYFAFTKVFDNDSTDSTQQSKYYQPLASFTAAEWSIETKISPWTSTMTPLTPANKQRGGLIFLWRDIRRTGNTSTGRVDNPFTARVRVFGKTAGPHAWDVYYNGYAFNTLSENPYYNISSASRWFMFHNHGRLIDNGVNTFVDAYMTIWDNKTTKVLSDQKTAMSEWQGRTVTLYKCDLHEPDTAGTLTQVASFSFTAQAVSQGYADSGTNYRCRITNNVNYYGYTCLPTNGQMAEYGMGGFYHLDIVPLANGGTPVPGTMYYIQIS